MIKLVNVSKYYSSHNVIALGLRKVNLELQSNEFVAIVGESGSGKTTLLNVICGIDSYEEGEMYLNGEETSYYSTSEMEDYRKKYIAFVFQNYNLIDAYTVLQNVEAPLVLAGYPKKQIRSKAIEIIKRVGLEKHIHHKATKLSGGQKQRVVIARALAKDCPIIAADEPTGNLDSASAKQILELLKEISKDKLVILVTHDYEQVKDIATRRIRIFDGEIVEDIEMQHVEKTSLPKLTDETKSIKFFDMIMIALRNLLSVPKKTILMLSIFSIFVFFVALAYGSFNAALRDIEGFGNSYFNNASISRIVLSKSDGSAFSETDLTELYALNLTQTIIPRDYVLDQNFWLANNTSGQYDLWLSGRILPSSILDDDIKLLAGELPANNLEALIAISPSNLNDFESYIGLIFKASDYDESPLILKSGIKVVGIVSAAAIYMPLNYSNDSYLIVSDDAFNEIGKSTYFQYLTDSKLTLNYNSESQVIQKFISSIGFEIDNTLPNNKLMLPTQMYPCVGPEDDTCIVTGKIDITDVYTSYTVDNLTFGRQATNTGYYRDVIKLNQTTYNRLTNVETYQISLITNTDVGVDGFVVRLRSIGSLLGTGKYDIIYPYRSQSSDSFSAIIQMFSIIGATITVAFTMLASVLISYVIFKAIINTKMHDYAIFRTIGANQKTIKKMIYLENYLTATLGYIIIATVMIILNNGNTFLSDILKYYLWSSYLVLFGMALFMAFSISSRYCRKVFKESVSTTLKTE